MTPGRRDWPAIDAATRGPREPRVPFMVAGHEVGSVAGHHLSLLRSLRAEGLLVQERAVTLFVEASRRDAVLAGINRRLHEAGAIVAWRDEPYAVVDPSNGTRLARLERAASRFWGTLTFGGHATGYVVGADGRPGHLWIAQRALDKATDPGLFDNLVGGGVPDGQSPYEAVLREGWEEAGLTRAQMQRATPGRRIRLWRAIPEGLQHEWLSSFDLMLAPDEVPRNQDGEVANFRLLPVADALALAAGDTMTVDAALVTLDFGLRHALLDAAEHAELAARAEGLWLP